MKKIFIIGLLVANLIWGIFFTAYILDLHSEKWYIKLILVFPLILFLSFSFKYISNYSEKYGHYMSMVLYSIVMILALGLIINYI